MAIIVVKSMYAREADALAAHLKDRGVTLTRNSKKLLRIAVQGWYEEPPEFVEGEHLDKEKLKYLLSKIVDEAAEEEHVVAKKRKGEAVAFTDLFSGVFRGGQRVIGHLVRKGFSAEEA